MKAEDQITSPQNVSPIGPDFILLLFFSITIISLFFCSLYIYITRSRSISVYMIILFLSHTSISKFYLSQIKFAKDLAQLEKNVDKCLLLIAAQRLSAYHTTLAEDEQYVCPFTKKPLLYGVKWAVSHERNKQSIAVASAGLSQTCFHILSSLHLIHYKPISFFKKISLE